MSFSTAISVTDPLGSSKPQLRPSLGLVLFRTIEEDQVQQSRGETLFIDQGMETGEFML